MFNLLALTYSYTTTTTNTTSTNIWSLLIGLWIFALFIFVIYVIALWKVFEKAGIPGWKALIPIYNSWLMFEMAGKPGWWALIGLAGVIPVLGFIAGIAAFILYIIAALEIGKAFGKSTAFSVIALIIFSIIGLLILGYGDAKYTKPASAPAKFS